MGGADWDADPGCHFYDGGGGAFRGEPMNRSHGDDTHSQRAYDPRPPEIGAQRHNTGRQQNHPEGYLEGFQIVSPAYKEGQGNYSHGLLRIVGAVAEGHRRRRHYLQLAEDCRHHGRAYVAEHPIDGQHYGEPAGKSKQWGKSQTQDDL